MSEEKEGLEACIEENLIWRERFLYEKKCSDKFVRWFFLSTPCITLVEDGVEELYEKCLGVRKNND